MDHAQLTKDAAERLNENKVGVLSDDEKAKAAWEVMQHYANLPFAWDGVADCCAFAGELVKVFHGEDYMARFQYKNKAEALRAIKEHGNLVDAITSVMGEPRPVIPEELEVGDVLIAEQTDGTWIPGIFIMGRMVVRTAEGIMDWPVQYAQHAWRPGQCLKP